MSAETEQPCREADADLILQAKSRDEAARVKLLDLYSPLIASLAYRYSATLPEDERNDLTQEATIAFLNALEQFDPEKNIAFGYFAKICISNRLIGYLRKRSASLADSALPIEDADTAAEDDPARAVFEQEAYLALCAKIRNLLSDLENSIFALYVSGLSTPQIAEKLHIDRKSVENSLARIRRKLKNNLPFH